MVEETVAEIAQIPNKESTSQLSNAERGILAKEFDRFSPGPKLKRKLTITSLGDLLRHLGPRWAKRPENITHIGPDIQRIFIPQENRYMQIAGVEIKNTTDTPEQFTSSDPFTEFVLRNGEISQESLRILVDYTQKGGKLVMIRSEKPTEQFQQALADHAKEYNGGISLLTQAAVLMDGLQAEHEIASDPAFSEHEDINLSDAEDQSLHQLVRLANNGNAIHFSALTPDHITGEVSPKVKQALTEINKKIDPYEFVYWTLSSLSEKQRRNQVEALSLLAVGGAMPELLQNFVAQFGPAWQMITGSFTGDIFAGVMAGRGNERKVKAIFERMRDFITHIGEKLKTDSLLQHRLLGIAGVVGVTATGVVLTVATGGWLLPFLLASPLSSTIIMGTEWHKRMTMNPKSPEEIRDILEAHMHEKTPPILKKFAELFPKSMLAWYDLAKNPTAMGAWAGTGISVPALMILGALLPGQIPLPWVVATSTLIAENATGAISGTRTVFRDPWRTFERELPRIQHLIERGKQVNSSAIQ